MAIRRNAVERESSGKLVIAENLAPTVAERDAFRERYIEIQDGLRPAGIDDVKRRMARFFLLFPVSGQTADMLEETADAYARVLSSMPLWAVDKACKRVISSGATFRPSAPELRKMADAECQPYYGEAATLLAIEDAEPYRVNTDDGRARVKAGFASLIAQLSGTNFVSGGSARTGDQARRDVEAGFPHLQGPLAASEFIRAQNAQRNMGDE